MILDIYNCYQNETFRTYSKIPKELYKAYRSCLSCIGTKKCTFFECKTSNLLFDNYLVVATLLCTYEAAYKTKIYVSLIGFSTCPYYYN